MDHPFPTSSASSPPSPACKHMVLGPFNATLTRGAMTWHSGIVKGGQESAFPPIKLHLLLRCCHSHALDPFSSWELMASKPQLIHKHQVWTVFHQLSGSTTSSWWGQPLTLSDLDPLPTINLNHLTEFMQPNPWWSPPKSFPPCSLQGHNSHHSP